MAIPDSIYVTNQYPFKTYKALLTQTPPITDTDIIGFDNKFIIGERYTIDNYVGGAVTDFTFTSIGGGFSDGTFTFNTIPILGVGTGLTVNVTINSGAFTSFSVNNGGTNYQNGENVYLDGGDGSTVIQITNVSSDDFSNVANVTSGTINQTGCVFIATGGVPTNWSNGSQLTSSGDFVVTELENNLGFDVSWVEFNPGIYFAFDDLGPSGNTFPRETTMTYVNQNGGYPVLSPNLILQSQSVSFIDVDNIILLSVYDFDIGDYTSGYLFYTPVEINILNTPA